MRLSNSVLAAIIFIMTSASTSHTNELAENSPAKLAIDGNIAAIIAFSDFDPKGVGDAKAYKWLVVAQDFGHRHADDAIADLMEISSLRYDDDGLVVGEIHYDLGVAYLTGADGLPKDFNKARMNLRASLPSLGYVTRDIEADRNRLAGEARSIFDAFFPPQTERTEPKCPPNRAEPRGSQTGAHDFLTHCRRPSSRDHGFARR